MERLELSLSRLSDECFNQLSHIPIMVQVRGIEPPTRGLKVEEMWNRTTTIVTIHIYIIWVGFEPTLYFSPEGQPCSPLNNGGDIEIRTQDSRIKSSVLYQLSYTPLIGTPERIRTPKSTP